MVGNFCHRTACIRNRRRRHDNNMILRKKRTPRASQHYVGWRAWQRSLLLPVAGEFFLLTLPSIEIRPQRVTRSHAKAIQDGLDTWPAESSPKPRIPQDRADFGDTGPS